MTSDSFWRKYRLMEMNDALREFEMMRKRQLITQIVVCSILATVLILFLLMPFC